MCCKNNMFESFQKRIGYGLQSYASAKSQIDVCLICIVDCSFIIAPQERIAMGDAFSNIKKIGPFHQVKSRGAWYEYNKSTYFFLTVCVLHNCEIQFDSQNSCEPTAEWPSKCG